MKNKNRNQFRLIKDLSYWFGIILVAVALGLSMNLVQAAWTNPGSNPPNSNLGAPLNTSDVIQFKKSPLWLNTNNTFSVGLLANKGIYSLGDLMIGNRPRATYNMRIGTINSGREYRRVDNLKGPWIYAFGVSPDAKWLSGSVGIRVDGSRSRYASLIVGKGKGQFADVWASGFRRGSDIRLKKDIKTIKNALEKLKNIRGVEYKLKDNNQASMGVIAQEIEKDFPTLVSKGIGGYEMVDYDGFAGVFIEAFKEQQKQIEEQQKQIDELKEMISDLKKD